MKNWKLNHTAMVGLWNADLITFEGSDGQLVHPDVARVTAPQHLTVRVGSQVLDVVDVDLETETWELRAEGSLWATPEYQEGHCYWH